jgi:single-stranded DNA-specific DHH superfamily exonuclease
MLKTGEFAFAVLKQVGTDRNELQNGTRNQRSTPLFTKFGKHRQATNHIIKMQSWRIMATFLNSLVRMTRANLKMILWQDGKDGV